MFNFGTPYANLNPAQQFFADAAIRNVMSFRAHRVHWALGFARWISPRANWIVGADVASTSRLAACDGRTFFSCRPVRAGLRPDAARAPLIAWRGCRRSQRWRRHRHDPRRNVRRSHHHQFPGDAASAPNQVARHRRPTSIQAIVVLRAPALLPAWSSHGPQPHVLLRGCCSGRTAATGVAQIPTTSTSASSDLTKAFTRPVTTCTTVTNRWHRRSTTGIAGVWS